MAGNFIAPEVVTGTINGVNDIFFTSVPYAAGTLAVYLNGQLMHPDGYTENDPDTGEIKIELACVPRTGDVLTASFFDQEEVNLTNEVDTITLSIKEDPVLSMVTSEDSYSMTTKQETFSMVISEDTLIMTLKEEPKLSFVLEVCDAC